jgi:hypothetical protein
VPRLTAASRSQALADRVLAEILVRDPSNTEALDNRRVLHHRAGWLQ